MVGVNLDFVEDLREVYKAGKNVLIKAIKKEKIKDAIFY